MEESYGGKKEDVVWSPSNGSIFENFAISLQEYTRTGKAPAEGDQDIQYGLELQKKRLRAKELTMQYKFVPRGHLAGGMKKIWTLFKPLLTLIRRSLLEKMYIPVQTAVLP